MSRRRKWLLGLSILAVAIVGGLLTAVSILSRRFEPAIREQAIAYLSRRFDSEVELAALHVKLPKLSPLQLMSNRGRGVIARVEGDGVVLRQRGRRDVPPLFTMKSFRFDVDLGTLWDNPRHIPQVTLEQLVIRVPPKGSRTPLVPARADKPADAANPGQPGNKVLIDEVLVRGAVLEILPRNPGKQPLHFDIHALRLKSAGLDVPMKYEAQLDNPKPPGHIDSQGTFGPWAAGEPGDTPLKGTYHFSKADLGVFPAIAGILDSTGEFQGTLSSIEAKGEARVPDFRLTMSGNPVPLSTQFEVLVDGTNGNTVLKPVRARLGSTQFTTSGGVIKQEGDLRRSIDLDVLMPNGNLRDLLRLAMKGSPFMEGRLNLKTRIGIPPLSGKVREKLRLNGRFEVTEAKFLRSTVQTQIDQLSRRGQGQPKNEEIDSVASRMRGQFQMQNEVISFRSLTFGVPGADVDLAGNFDIGKDMLDFHGALKLQARVSETMTGWKRWALKPVNPFFAKNGAGTFLRIQVVGPARKPSFGLDKSK